MSNDIYVPLEDLATHFTISPSTARTWVRQGLIPKDTYIKVGNTYRFCIPKVIAALTANNTDEQNLPEPATDDGKIPVQLELDFNNPDEDA